MDKVELQRRTKRFALDVVRFCGTLPTNGAASIIARQLLRSGTSVGANYRAACIARSRAEFIAKMCIVAEEADESQYWMELLVESGMCPQARLADLSREAGELSSIAVASRMTARGVRA